ncbi:beta strand repeat-containing protein, partial [Methylobacterium goesingense]|uniref:beta strand repeat-containing protein n=1 Tax=Methylobacterium goesingense TaxID=243690 RepID=UPI0024B617CC
GPRDLLTATAANNRFALADNLDAAGQPTLLAPINTTPTGVNVPFTGKFNGLGHSISNLNITSANQYVGLFGTTVNATIANVQLINFNVIGRYTGTSESFVGGLVGQSTTSTIYGVSISGNVTNSATNNPTFSYTGGLVGQSTSSIGQSSSSGTVTGGAARESETGGLVGNNAGSGSVSRSFSSSNVSGSSAGGVSSDTGGLIGWNTSSGTVGQVYATGNVVGGSNVAENSASYTGGLVGYNAGSGSIQQASSSGTVRGGQANGTTATGGLIGYLQTGSVTQAYSMGSVFGGTAVNAVGVIPATGISRTGGLIGINTGTLNQTYTSGIVTAGVAVNVSTGGLVGFNGSGGGETPSSTSTVSASFWDTATTGQAAAAGNAATLAGATGLTTAQFQNAATFVPLATGQGWNFQTTWAPPSAGFYPELYSIAPVVSVSADAKTKTYGQANPLLTGTVFGGPGTYVFDASTVQPSAATLLTTSATQTSGVDNYAISSIAAPFVSTGNTNYRVTGTGSTLAVTPAPLTIRVNDQTKTFGQTFTFAGTEFQPVGLVNGDQVTRVTLTSQGEPASAPVTTYPIVASAAQGTGLVNTANNRSNYAITYTDGTLTVNPVPVPPQTPAERASAIANASVTPNIAIGLTNLTAPPLPLTSSINLSVASESITLGGGGPTLGVGSGTGDGSSTVASGTKTLAAINTASSALNAKLNACEKTNKKAVGGYTACVGDSLETFAATLDLRVQQLPPAFRGLPAIIRQAAQRVRTAATIGEARAAVRVAVTAIRKAISLLRADEPAVARVQARQGRAIASALQTVDARLSRAVGL